MTVINTNVGALQARTYAVRADGNVTKAMERLSSGLRINSAADDAAGLAVANKMESQIRGMNMAIRNSQDGISLVQTAESAMGEINNMVIRMRELAVQMNNGVYTDADRENAQLEVTALLEEIDKVATNSAFNQVKILDGTYSQDIRAGNTNPEIINVTIDRMNTDSLGGGKVTTGETKATLAAVSHVVSGVDTTLAAGGNTAKHFETTLTAKEGRPSIAFSTLGLDAYANTAAGGARGGTYDIVAETGTDHAKFAVVNGEITLASGTTELDFENGSSAAGSDTYTFKVSYVNGSTTVTDTVSLKIEDKAVRSASTTSPLTGASISVEEGVCITIAGGGNGSQMSDEFKEFVNDTNNTNPVVYSLEASTTTGNTGDLTAGGFAVNNVTGEITGSADFERPTDGGTNNSYEFTVVATRGTVEVKETITVNVTDFQDDTNSVADEANWAASSSNATPSQIMSTGDIVAKINHSAANETVDLSAFAATATFMTATGNTGDNNFEVVSVDGVAAGSGNVTTTAIATGLSIDSAGVLTIDEDATGIVPTKVEDVLIRFTGDTGDTFEFLIDITLEDNAGGAIGGGDAAAYVQRTANANADGITGNHSTIAVDAGGEAARLDLTTSGDNKFDALATFYGLNACGLFEVENLAFNGTAIASGAANENAVTVNSSGELVLEEGIAAGVYSLDVRYETNDGATFLQRMDITVSEVGVRGENVAARTTTNAVATNGTATAHATQTATQVAAESRQVAGVTIANMAEGRQGTLQATGGILSDAFDAFVADPDNANGTFSVGNLNGSTDAALFTIDASTGAIETKGLVDYESKTEYNITVSYTTADENNPKTYTEDVTIRVADDKVDNTTHIINVDLGTQDKAATAVTILDKAINQISSSQAKLGAIQNRLQYNIDNLSKASMLTQTAKGRIMDADFASETSELSKQQILSQAATSMLAQANQSKQSVLALLQ